MVSTVVLLVALWAVTVPALFALAKLLGRLTAPRPQVATGPRLAPLPGEPRGDVVPLVPRPRNGLAPVVAEPRRAA
jgi:hypothetical protein